MDNVIPVIFKREGYGLTRGSLAKVSKFFDPETKGLNLVIKKVGRGERRINMMQLEREDRKKIAELIKSQMVRVTEIGDKTCLCTIQTNLGWVSFNLQTRFLEKVSLAKKNSIKISKFNNQIKN